ncbi:hypothetical protein M427DRAFT_495274 [Gonapodya prolifera JEL478]|uniref:Uncharacterized protein n=1 Tax=Gonapodya prolifera (strain JEL478) TaxID=1344416 RepID=A0A138ZWC7_GONPJ|nr:hypothetical protein M427DRAFT_495274 [Gonapodya prolifera JEL478]|eukprot:KXS08820.1 hypothetical protein M427DRAFT_495274 [Gonapodya prolifera JEL478]
MAATGLTHFYLNQFTDQHLRAWCKTLKITGYSKHLKAGVMGLLAQHPTIQFIVERIEEKERHRLVLEGTLAPELKVECRRQGLASADARSKKKAELEKFLFDLGNRKPEYRSEYIARRIQEHDMEVARTNAKEDNRTTVKEEEVRAKEEEVRRREEEVELRAAALEQQEGVIRSYVEEIRAKEAELASREAALAQAKEEAEHAARAPKQRATRNTKRIELVIPGPAIPSYPIVPSGRNRVKMEMPKAQAPPSYAFVVDEPRLEEYTMQDIYQIEHEIADQERAKAQQEREKKEQKQLDVEYKKLEIEQE